MEKGAVTLKSNSMKLAARAACAASMALCVAGVAHGQEVYVTGGTLGAGLGGAWNFNPHVGLHLDAEGFGFSHSVTVDDNQYDGHLSLKQGGLYLDLFPFASSAFRVTAGALINDDTLDAHAVPNADGNYKIGNEYVPAIGAAPSATATMPHVMPYLGIGYGHKKQTKGFGLTADLGVAYGRPHVSYSVPDVYSQLVSQQDIADEEQQLSNKIDKYRWYPVVQLGVTYRF